MSDLEQLEALRKKFEDGVVGKLPKPYKADNPKGNCQICGGWHGLPAAHLDFVGHAAVTDRLLNVDLAWTWEPMALDERGSPALDREGNLWIRLTVCGVTRIGVGDGPTMKVRIGDAIRNAAMRFGVALSLWTKDELESGHLESGKSETPPDAQPERLEPPPGMVFSADAKTALLYAYDGDKDAAKAAWGDRGNNLIAATELDGLIEASGFPKASQ